MEVLSGETWHQSRIHLVCTLQSHLITFLTLVCYHGNHVYRLTDVNRISKPSMHSVCVVPAGTETSRRSVCRYHLVLFVRNIFTLQIRIRIHSWEMSNIRPLVVWEVCHVLLIRIMSWNDINVLGHAYTIDKLCTHITHYSLVEFPYS